MLKPWVVLWPTAQIPRVERGTIQAKGGARGRGGGGGGDGGEGAAQEAKVGARRGGELAAAIGVERTRELLKLHEFLFVHEQIGIITYLKCKC